MRKWHRWIGLPAGICLLLTALTGVWLECERFFGEEEALREKVRDLASKHTAKAPAFAIEEKLIAARAAVATKFPDAPLDKIQLPFFIQVTQPSKRDRESNSVRREAEAINLLMFACLRRYLCSIT